MTRYIAALLFTAAAIAAFPLTVRSNDGTERRTDSVVAQGVREIATGTDRGIGGQRTLSTTFRVTAYCACRECCGAWSRVPVESGNRRTASGYKLRPDGSDALRICAAPAKYPFGTKFDLGGGRVVVCEDRGGSIKAAGDTVAGKVLTHDRLDILMEDHQTALEWGVKYLEVKVVTP